MRISESLQLYLQWLMRIRSQSEIDGVEVVANTVDEDVVDVDEDFINDSDCDEDIIDYSDEDYIQCNGKTTQKRSSGGAGTWVRGTSTLPKELQDVGHKQWLWDNIKDSWELDETRKEPTLGPISLDEFRNKKSKWKRKFYTPYTTYEERAISERNKANRAKQIAKHAAGRISFPQFEEIMEKMNHLAGRDEHGTQLPLTNEIYREVMPPERHGRVRLRGRGVTPTNYFGSRLSSDNRVNDLENQVVEMKRVAEEKEEERQREIEEMRRQAQDKDEQRQHEMDEMKRQFNARDADMDARLMQKLLEMTTTRSRLSSN
ncbi:hypothetical protein IFM89_016341 [Coptis chinensis]|uniref:Uncharacterized protein n=1 Tax=Coptis chinensis TaxID=261450 RepID=A0A835HBB8_9MAGN|nr:hypothetical protein IFM89_016341 [Coptis chinensis]